MSKYEDLSGLTDDELIDRYVANAIECGKHEGYSARPVVAGTAVVRRVGAVYSELRRRGRDAQERLLDLLNHPIDSVRNCAGGAVLDFAPARMIPTLEEEATQEGLEGLVARVTLQELKDGTRKPTRDFLYRTHPTVAESERWPAVPQEVANILASVGNRLDAEAPDLGQAFRQASLDKRRLVALDAIGYVLGRSDLRGEETEGGVNEVEDAEYALHFEKLPALAEHQRIVALASRLRAEVEQRGGDLDKPDDAGAMHAALALAIALTGDWTRLDEVIHETIAAQNQPESFIPYLVKMLREPQKN